MLDNQNEAGVDISESNSYGDYDDEEFGEDEGEEFIQDINGLTNGKHRRDIKFDDLADDEDVEDELDAEYGEEEIDDLEDDESEDVKVPESKRAKH